jgi:hypothetical protein
METIPNIRAQVFASNASTDAPPEPQHDIVYRVSTPNGPTRTYVHVTKIYGDKGIAKCRILKAFNLDGSKIVSREGKSIDVGFEHLIEPDVFPKLAYSKELWNAKASKSLDELKVLASELIDGYMQTEAIAYDLRDDGEKTISGIKLLLSNYIGPFLLTFLLAFVRKHIEKVIRQREGKPTPKKTFDRKLSEMKRLFTKPIVKQTDGDKKGK